MSDLDGVQRMAQMKAAGFSDDEVKQYQTDAMQQMTSAGFNSDEVNQYFGINSNPDLSKVTAGIKSNIDTHVAANTSPEGEKKPLTFAEALNAGFGGSVTGLIASGKAPTELTGNEPWYTRMAANVARLYGDAPAMVAGAVAGAPVGTALGAIGGTAVEPGGGTAAGAAVGSAAGAMAGAFAVPTMIRESLIDGYKNGDFKSVGDWWDRVGPILLHTARDAAVGATTAGAGGVAGGTLVKAGAAPIVATAGATAAEVATVASMGKMLSGQMPDSQDFLDAAVLIGGLKAAGAAPDLVSKLQETYAKTGVPPQQVARDTSSTPSVVQDLASANKTVPTAYADRVEPTMEPQPEASAESAPTPTEEPPPAPPEPGSDEAARQAILDKIKDPTEGEDPSQGSFYTRVIDQRDPIAVMEKAAGAGDASAYDSAFKRMSLLPGIDSRFEAWMKFGPVMPDAVDPTGPGLASILAPFKGDIPNLTAYWAAKQAIEMESKGINSGMPLDAAKQFVAADAGKYDEAAKALTAFANNNIGYLRGTGILSEDAANTILEKWNSYAPFNRVIETEGGFGIGNSIRNPVKARTGSDLDVLNPIAQLVQNTRTTLAIGAKNQAVKSFYELAKAAENPADFMEEVPASMRPITVSADEMTRFLEKNGIEGTPDDLLTTFRAMRTPLAKDEVGFFDDGQWKVLKVDPEIAKAFNETAVPAQGVLMSLARGVASMFRSGLVSPDFIVRHLLRNQIATSTIAAEPVVPFLTMFKGMAEVVGKTEAYQDYLNSGAGMSADFTGDSPIDIVHKLAGESPAANFPTMAWNLVKTPFELAHAAQAFLEKSTRVGAFSRYMSAEDRTPENIADAAVAARNVAPDPARIGSSTSTWNAITPLFNIELQHTDQLVQAIKSNPLGTLTRIMGLVTIPSIALWYAHRNDEVYQDMPQWEKDMFWVLPPIGADGARIKIAKPFLLGYLFGSGPEHILDAINGSETGTKAAGFASNIFESVLPNILPGVVRPVAEQVTNHSFFRDAPLVPDSLTKDLPELRYNDYTTELTKQMGHLIGTVPYIGETSIASPMVIDNYIRQWSGANGVLMVNLADKALRSAGVLPDPVKPTATLADIPVVKSFVVRYPSAQTASIMDFEAEHLRRSMYLNSVNKLAEEGNPQAVQIMSNHQAEMDTADEISQSIAEASRTIHLINQNPAMGPDQKRQLIDTTYYQMIQMAKQGNEEFRISAETLKHDAASLGH